MTASRTAIAAAVIVLSACALGASAQPLLLTPTGSPTPGQAPPELAFLQSGLFTPVVAAAARAMACGPYCDTFSGGTTATEQGAGSSCAAAQTSLTSQLQDLARADCRTQTGFGICNFVITYTQTCHQVNPTTYQVNGYATYNCRDTTC